MFDQIRTNYDFLLQESLFMAPMSYKPTLRTKLDCLLTAIIKRDEITAYIHGDSDIALFEDGSWGYTSCTSSQELNACAHRIVRFRTLEWHRLVGGR